MHRFFIDKSKINGNVVSLEQEDALHIYKVLRLREGDTIELCDGQGIDYTAKLGKVSADYVEAHIQARFQTQGEPRLKTTLYQAIHKGPKMDIIIQKCVELGVSQIVPIVTARTIIKLENPKSQKRKVERWQRIAQEAAKQSRRGIIPIVSAPIGFGQALQNLSAELRIFLWEEERDLGLKKYLEEALEQKTEVAIIVGPEGGWEEQEVYKARDFGWDIISLGPRILRTETVGISVLSAIMFYAGEMQWKTH